MQILKRDISVREEAQQNLVLPMLLDFLVVVLPRMRPRGKDLTGVVELVMSEVHYLALSGTESSSLVERCEVRQFHTAFPFLTHTAFAAVH